MRSVAACATRASSPSTSRRVAHVTESFRYPGSLLVIGGGRMGEAIAGGLLRAGVLDTTRVTVVEPDAGRRQLLADSLGILCVDNAELVSEHIDIVLLAVKPQIIDEVVSSLPARLAEALIVSIAAGVDTARLEALLADGSSVVRVMPNAPALVGSGMAVVSGGSRARADQVETVRALFGSIGEAVIIEEDLQNAAVAISGSGPAYFALVVHSLALAGVHQGLPEEVAQSLALQTMLGTSELMRSTGLHPLSVIEMVSSPGGTTVAALESMHRAGLPEALAEGVAAAVRRATELGG
jgi:pyrroline-5-carboxylate reductase